MVPGVEPPLLLRMAEGDDGMASTVGGGNDEARKAFDRGSVTELTAEQKEQAAKDRETTDTVSRLRL